MIELERVGDAGRGRAARLRAWTVIVLPILVLAAVVGGGVLGGVTNPAPSSTADPIAGTRESPAAGTQPAAVATPATRPAGRPLTAGAPLPGEILGMRVLDVGEARGGPRVARPEQLVAVGGWLQVSAGEPGCAVPWHLACRRTGILTGSRLGDGPTLDLEVQPGVPLPGLQRQDPRTGTSSVPNQAVLIGRFTRPLYRECGMQIPECAPLFTVERLAWIRRAPRERPLAYGPGATSASLSPEGAEATAREAFGGTDGGRVGETLLLALFDRDTLALIDDAAGDAARDVGPGTHRPLWYIRTIVWHETARGDEPRIGWAVVDDTTRTLVASGA